MDVSVRDFKVCKVCGRRFFWRKRWEKNWSSVTHCSDACRKRGLRAADEALEKALMQWLLKLPKGKSMCPSELARELEPEEEKWRALMEPIRMAARRLYHKGLVRVLQRGEDVDPDSARGAIRLSATRGPKAGLRNG